MGFTGTQRPRPRWHHATTELADLAIISYRADAEAVRRHLPEGFSPDVFHFDDGSSGTLVSAVVFRDCHFHFRFCRPLSLSCGQINYRAYVRTSAGPGVWFFGTSFDHRLVAVPRILWKMPWSRGRIRIDADWDGPARWRLRADDDSGRSHCELVETPGPLGRLDGFADEEDVIQTITHPMLGWYRRRDGDIGHYSVWHPAMTPRCFRASTAHFTFLERLGLIVAHAQPHSALAQQALRFDVHTPPRRLAC